MVVFEVCGNYSGPFSSFPEAVHNTLSTFCDLTHAFCTAQKLHDATEAYSVSKGAARETTYIFSLCKRLENMVLSLKTCQNC